MIIKALNRVICDTVAAVDNRFEFHDERAPLPSGVPVSQQSTPSSTDECIRSDRLRRL
jgi:hypothetical protein